MSSPRKQHSGAFKAQVALAALRGDRTMPELSSEYGVHPTVITRWGKQVLEVLPGLLSGKAAPGGKETEGLRSRLYQEIGQLKVELDWLKKNLDCDLIDKRSKIDFGHHQISVSRQYQLLGLSRSSLYYQPVPEDEENIRLTRMIDEKFGQGPFYEHRRIWNYLREKGEEINIKRVWRLMKTMGLEAIYPKPRLSRPEKWSENHPYLLRGLAISKPDQVLGFGYHLYSAFRGFCLLGCGFGLV